MLIDRHDVIARDSLGVWLALVIDGFLRQDGIVHVCMANCCHFRV